MSSVESAAGSGVPVAASRAATHETELHHLDRPGDAHRHPRGRSWCRSSPSTTPSSSLRLSVRQWSISW
jgi:hypothetical protein